MKITSVWFVLLMTGVYGLDVGAHVDHDESDLDVELQSNHHGWANPEDLPSMPQCIAQQDQSAWLRAMTSCTRERCTSLFIFCTHKQWLTQLSCLSTAISPDLIRQYFPYCGRSILAKAQLYQWIHTITGRTWLIDVGDAIELQDLSPASLAKGYTNVDVIHKAPTCLIDSASALSNEHFQRVMASCSFTDTPKHTGNAERPWEYRGRQHSLIALDYETVGYDLALNYHNYLWNRLSDGEYFDRACFCDAYTLNFDREPCSGSGDSLELTKERLWMHATCGSESLPPNWADNLKTTEYAFIPVEDWHWPSCVLDMPKLVIELTDQCATEACEIDSTGFCRVRRAVDRACVCRSISYDSCGGSCHIFENRIGYIDWLYDLCGNEQGWDGLPDNWRELAVPTPAEMIPWRWTVKPSNDSNGHSGYTRPAQTCPSNAWKLGSFALVNTATFLGVVSSWKIMGTSPRTAACGRTPWQEHPVGWVYKGTLIAALQLLANGVNSFAIVQRTPGYEAVPALQLMLLWSSIPRLSWLAVMVIVLQPLQQARKFSAVASLVFAEVILQSLSSYYMLMTFNYGREHDFYFGALDGAEKRGPAEIMYAGALVWLFCAGAALVGLMQARREMDSAGAGWQRAERTSRTGGYHNHGAYGTFSSRGQGRTQDQWGPQPQRTVTPEFSYVAADMFMFLLWTTQWLFWSGFIGLSSEEFCPPNVKLLTAVWIFASWIGVDIARL